MAFVAFFSIESVSSVFAGDAAARTGFGALALGILIIFRNLFIGIWDIILVANRSVDLVFEENAVGILIRGERRYLFLDGTLSLRKYRDDVWTLEHFNGSVLHIPVATLTEDQLSHVRAAMERGRTPEGIKAVIERGKRIEAIMRAEREA